MPILPRIFIAYARADKSLLTKLRLQLDPLQRNQHCHIFWDGEIIPGEAWDKRLKNELHEANIFVLLVSPDFLASNYVNETELPKAMQRWREGTVQVVPVILRDCLWEVTELEQLQVVMKDGEPIEERNGYAHAAREVFKVVKLHNETLRLAQEADEVQRQTAEAEKLRLAEEERQRKAAEVQRQKEEAERQRRRSLDPFHDLMLPTQGGAFKMGDKHEVIVKDFHLCKHPVTQAQWRAIMGSDPPELAFKGCDDCPVESVSWDDVQDFIKKLNEKTGEKYRLPAEAEWEFAAAGGNQSKKYKYAGSDDLNEVGWFWENSGDKQLSGNWEWDKISKNKCRTHPVCGKKANELGLHDMSGNVLEWCQGTYHDNYQGAPSNGSPWTSGGKEGIRVVRGGSWIDSAVYCHSAYRGERYAYIRVNFVGFRLAR